MGTARIMIVEDEAIIAMDLKKSVEAMGYSVCAMAVSGREALQKVSETRPDLVLMDIMLKGEMDGIDVAERMNSASRVPVIYLTAYYDEELLQRAKITTPYGYITKPFGDRELHIAIEIGLYKQQAEARIRRTEHRLAAVLRSVGDGVIASDNDGRVTFMNRVAEELTGWTLEDGSGKMISSILKIKDEEPGSLERQLVERVIREGQIINLFEDRLLVSRNGTEIPISDSVAPIRDNDGEMPGTVLVFRDITEQRRLTDERQNAVDRLHVALQATVQSIAALVETRDPYTAGHQRRVASLAAAIAGEMGLPGDEIDGIRMASTIHDIGKVSVPAEILSKPTRLSDLEFSLIKAHPRSGYNILKEIDFPWPVARMVLEHHEKFDGSGYPEGLSGRETLIGSRIIAVADVVEAVASHRPYRPSLGIAFALSEIEIGSGTCYDPAVVDSCLRLFREKGYQMEGATSIAP